MKTSVGSKIFVLFFASIFLFVVILGFASYQISKQNVMDKTSSGYYQTIAQAGQKLDLLFGLYESLTNGILSDPNVLENSKIYFNPDASLLKKSIAEKEIKTRLRNNRYSLPGVEGITLISANDRETLVDSNYSGLPVEDGAEWMKRIMDGDGALVWLDTAAKGYAVQGPRPVFALGRLQKNDKTPLIVLIEVSVDVLRQQLQTIDLGQTGQLRILNAKHEIMESPNDGDIGKPLNIQVEDGQTSQYRNDPNGNRLLVVTQASEKNGWIVAGYTQVSDIVKQTGSIFKLTLIMVLCAIVFALVVGWFAAGMFGKPLRQLRDMMKVSASGVLTVRANFKNKDEIGQLGESFNRMMINFTLLIEKTNQSAHKVLEAASALLHSSRLTAKSADDIDHVMKEIAEGSSNLSQEAERNSALTGEMYGKTTAAIQANERMRDIAEVVRVDSDQGIGYLKEVVEHTNRTNELTRDMLDKVNGLKGSARSIRQVLDLLNNLAKQTNILALNAGIEAARAGAAGKGFMVISREVRQLADQSEQSIDMVADITHQIQRDVDHTAQALEKAYPMFQKQIGTIRETDRIFNKVAESMESYRTQLDSVTGDMVELQRSGQWLNDAMHHVSAISQEAAASTQEVAALSKEQLGTSQSLVSLSESLEKLSGELRQSLSEFTI